MSSMRKNFLISIGIFLSLAASRFIPHPPNFTSLLALSFYVPAIFGIRYLPVLLISFAITDIIIGYHMGWDNDEYISKGPIVSVSKIDSFALYGGGFDRAVVNNLNIFLKFRYFVLKFISKLFWVSFKILWFILFLLKGRLFFFNKLLYKQ